MTDELNGQLDQAKQAATARLNTIIERTSGPLKATLQAVGPAAIDQGADWIAGLAALLASDQDEAYRQLLGLMGDDQLTHQAETNVAAGRETAAGNAANIATQKAVLSAVIGVLLTVILG